MFELTAEEQALAWIHALPNGSVVIGPRQGRLAIVLVALPFLALGFAEVFFTSMLRRNTDQLRRFPFALSGPPLRAARLVQAAGLLLMSFALVTFFAVSRRGVELHPTSLNRVTFRRQRINWSEARAVYRRETPRTKTQTWWQVVVDEADLGFVACGGNDTESRILHGLIERYRTAHAGPWPEAGGLVPIEDDVAAPLIYGVLVLQILSWIVQI